MPYANNKGADQPAHPRSLINAFVVHCLDSIIPLVSISKLSSLYLSSVAAQAGLSLPCWQTLKTGFLVTGFIWFYQSKVSKRCRRHGKHCRPWSDCIWACSLPVWATSWQNKQYDWAPAKTQISLGIRPVWSESSLCTQWVAKDPSFLHLDSEDWSNRAHFCWFCHEAVHICVSELKVITIIVILIPVSQPVWRQTWGEGQQVWHSTTTTSHGRTNWWVVLVFSSPEPKAHKLSL